MVTVRECAGQADFDEAWRLRALAFGGPRTPPQGWEQTGWQGWLATGPDGPPCGFARAWPLRQFYGGTPVPAAGLSSVAVDPHARGRGVASALLRAILPALRAAGQPLSVLYPSAPPLYRGHGWEYTGVAETVDVPVLALHAAQLCAPDSRLRPVTEADLPAVRECYLALAATVDGLLDRSRPPFDLSHVLAAEVATLVDGPCGPRGYLAASRAEPPHDESRLNVHELVALDVGAEQALLASLASWAGRIDEVRLPLLQRPSLCPVAFDATVQTQRWMLRVVDLPAAVAARGWPLAAQLRPGLAVDLDVVDDHAPWHAGPQRLECVDGGVTVSPGGSGAVRVTARGLAAWFAGTASSSALYRAGLLDGELAAARVLDAFTGVGGPARLLEFF